MKIASATVQGDADPRRRQLLTVATGLVLSVVIRPAAAAPDTLAQAISTFAGGAPVSVGKVVLDVATLVDNGNTVPVSITVDSPMNADAYVTAIALFNERNPQRDVARFVLTPHSGRAHVSTRIRLATSQKLTAVARTSDGAFWSHTVDVIVTLAACIEGD